jgi:hypothetical protein
VRFSSIFGALEQLAQSFAGQKLRRHDSGAPNTVGKKAPNNLETHNLVPYKKNSLTRAQFEQLVDVPPEEEWMANITNLKTRRAYKEDVREFIAFTALNDYMGLR